MAGPKKRPAPAPPTPEQLALRERREKADARYKDLLKQTREKSTIGRVLQPNFASNMLQGSTFNLEQLYRPKLILPAYQRAAVWDVERQVSFLNHVLGGGLIMPLTLLEVNLGEYLVVDGQQRLLALSAILYSLDGTPSQDHNIRFSLELGSFVDMGPTTEPNIRQVVKDVTEAGIFEADKRWALGELSDEEFAAQRVRHMLLLLLSQHTRVPVLTAGWAWKGNTDHAFQTSLFRTINTPGVPLAEEDLERLIAAADELHAKKA